MKYEKTCEVCGKKYEAERSNSKTCCSTCRVKLFFKHKNENIGKVAVEKVLNEMYLDAKGKEWKNKEEWLEDLQKRIKSMKPKLEAL